MKVPYVELLSQSVDWSYWLPLLGVSSIISGIAACYFQSIFAHRKQIKLHEHEVKMEKYLALNMKLLNCLDPELWDHPLRISHIDNQTKQELRIEYMNALVYASDGVIRNLNEFINSPCEFNYYSVAKEIRNDLWRKSNLVLYKYPEIR